MTITIGTFSCSTLTAQPFGYEGSPIDGYSSRAFQVAGLLTSSQWQALLNEYNTWRTSRLADADTLFAGTIGTTVSLTISSTNGVSVTGLACWFRDPPQGKQVGGFIDATAVLVDAAQSLAVLQREIVKGQQRSVVTEKLQADAKVAALTSGTMLEDIRAARALQAIYDKYLGEDLPDLGTVTLGSATIKLLRPMETYSDGPQVAFSAGGKSLISGPPKAHETRRIEGIVTSGAYSDLLSWFDTTISSTPLTGTWFPTAPPTASAEKFLVSGAVATRYTVTVEVKKII